MGEDLSVSGHLARSFGMTAATIRYVVSDGSVIVVWGMAFAWGWLLSSAVLGVYVLSEPVMRAIGGGGLFATGGLALVVVFLPFPYLLTKGVVASTVAQQCNPDETCSIRQTAVSMIRVTPRFLLLSPAYACSAAFVLATLGSNIGLQAHRLAGWPTATLVPPTVITDNPSSVRKAAHVARGRFNKTWKDAETSVVGFWSFFLPGVVTLIVILSSFVLTTVSVLRGAVLTVVIASLSTVWCSFLFAIPVIDGMIYAASREWPLPDLFSDWIGNNLF
jgi:hypothetical protein